MHFKVSVLKVIIYSMKNMLGDYVRELRESKNLSQRDLARLSGVSNTYIANLETGINPSTGKPFSPSVSTLEKLAKGLRVPVETLISLARGEQLTLDPEARKRELYARIRELQAQAKIAKTVPEAETIYQELLACQREIDALGVPEIIPGDVREVQDRQEKIEELHRFHADQVQMPYYGRVGCGKFLILNDHPEELRLIPRELAEMGDSVVEACGDSMNQAGILPGQNLIVKHQHWAEHGQVVLANIPYQGTTCKRYVMRDDAAYLVSESTSEYPEIKVEDGVNIVGVVKSLWYQKVFP